MNTDKIRAALQMAGSRVVKFNLQNDFVSIGGIEENKLKVDVSYQINSAEKNEDNPNAYIGIITVSIKTAIKDESGHKLSILMDIEGCFVGIDFTDLDEFNAMLGINGCAALYSIARAYIISATSQSLSGGQLILPMINTFKLAETSNSAEAKSNNTNKTISDNTTKNRESNNEP